MAPHASSTSGTRRILLVAVAVVGTALVSLLWLDDSSGGHPVRAADPRAPEQLPAADAAPLPTPTVDRAGAAVQPLTVPPATDAPATPPPPPTTLREGAEVVSLTGRVLDPAGAPLEGAELRFGQHGNDRRLHQPAWADPIEASYRRPPATGVVSDAEGRFTLYLDAAAIRTQTRAQGFVVVLAPGHAALVHRTPELLHDADDLGDLRLAAGTSLTARTVDLAGRPLAGVAVDFDSLLPDRSEDVRSGVRLTPHEDNQRFDVLRAVLVATSDDLGRLRLACLPGSTGRLRFARDDLPSLVLSVVLPGPVALGDVVLDPGGSIAGTLFDVDGQPVAGGYAAVILRDDGAGRDAEALRQAVYRAEREHTGEPTVVGRTRAKLSTDDQGRFGFSGLTDGWYELSVSADHHAWTHRAAVATGSTGLQLVLPVPGTLQLDIRDALTGEAVPAATVSASLPEAYAHLPVGIRWRYDITSDPALPGLVSVLGVGLEGARLTVSAAGYGTWSDSEGPVPPGAVITRDVRLVPGLHLSGVVIDERDEPLRGVRVSLSSVADRRGRDGLSDELGHFTIDDLAPGSFEIEGRGPGLLESRREPLELLASRDDFVVRLYREAVLVGRVLDRDAQPAPGVKVLAWPLWAVPAFQGLAPEPAVDLRSHVWAPLPLGVSDANGAYRLARMLPGRYAVFTTFDESLPDDLRRTRWNAGSFDVPEHALRVDVPGGGELVQDLTLPVSTSLFGTVRAGEHPAVGANVKLYVPVDGQPPWRLTASALSDPDGRYELRMQPGRYVVVVQARSGSFPVTRVLELAADTETRHDVVTGGGVVRGVVVEVGSGAPVPDVRVFVGPGFSAGAAWLEATGLGLDDLTALPADPPAFTVMTTSDADGRFELTDLPPGKVAAQTDSGGTLPAWAPWTTLTEREPLELTLEVMRGARIEGTLRYRSGEAVDQNAMYFELRDPLQDRGLAYAYLEDGRWSFDALQSGRYEVRLIDWDDDSVLLRETVHVTAGATEHLDLLLDDEP